jgi:hypothetical protein
MRALFEPGGRSGGGFELQTRAAARTPAETRGGISERP